MLVVMSCGLAQPFVAAGQLLLVSVWMCREFTRQLACPVDSVVSEWTVGSGYQNVTLRRCWWCMSA